LPVRGRARRSRIAIIKMRVGIRAGRSRQRIRSILVYMGAIARIALLTLWINRRRRIHFLFSPWLWMNQ